jgi:hypothetical protein
VNIKPSDTLKPFKLMDEKSWCVSAQGKGANLAIRVAAGPYLHAVIMPPRAFAWQAKGVDAVPGCVLPLIGQPLIKLLGRVDELPRVEV